MKYLLLAAAAVIAAPLSAQEAPMASADQSAPMTDAAPAPDASTAPDAMTPAAPTADQMAAPTPMAAPADPNAADPAGGYQPSAPAISGPVAPGATVVFRPAMTPDQAYPAPAPLKSYPVCKRGQYDNCKNPGGR